MATDEDWALEATQERILAVLEDMYDGKSTADVEKVLKQIEKNTKALNNIGKSLDSNKLGAAIKNASRSSTSSSSSTATQRTGGGGGPQTAATRPAGGGGGPSGTAAAAATGMGGLVNQMTQVFPALGKFAGALGSTTAVIGIFGAAMTQLGFFVSESIDGYRELNRVGFTFGGSLIEMRRQAAQAGMDFSTFGKILQKHSTIIGGVGTQSFIKLQNEVRDVNKGFGQFGYTLEETGTIVAEYLERQIRAGTFEEMDSKRRAQSIQTYMYQLNELSKITNRSREAMAADIKSMSENVDVRTATMRMDAESAERFRKGLEAMGPSMSAVSSEFAQALTDSAAQTAKFGNFAMSEFGKTAAVVGGQFAQGMEQFVVGIQNGGEGANEGLANLYASLDDPAVQRSLGDLAVAGDEGAKAVIAMMTDFEKLTDKQKAALVKQTGKDLVQLEKEMAARKKQMDAEQKLTAQLNNMQDVWGKAIGKIRELFINTLAPVLTYLGNSVLSFINIVADVVGAIHEFINPILEMMQPVKENSDAMKALGVAVGAIVTLFGALVVVQGAYKAAVIASTIALSPIKSAGKWIGPVFSVLGKALPILGTVAMFVGKALLSIVGALASPVALVVAGIALLAAISYAVYENWDKIVEVSKDVINWFGEIGTTIGNVFSNAFSAVTDAIVSLFKDLFDKILSILPGGDLLKKGASFLGSFFGGSEEQAATEVAARQGAQSNFRAITPINQKTLSANQQEAAQLMHAGVTPTSGGSKEQQDLVAQMVEQMAKQNRLTEQLVMSNEQTARNTKSKGYKTAGGQPGA